jgi:hypothetical protein
VAKHGGTSGHLIRSAFTLANNTGDPLAAAASCLILVWYVLVAGEPLVEAQKEAEAGLEFYRNSDSSLSSTPSPCRRHTSGISAASPTLRIA